MITEVWKVAIICKTTNTMSRGKLIMNETFCALALVNNVNMAAKSRPYVIADRSSGLFLNPNPIENCSVV